MVRNHVRNQCFSEFGRRLLRSVRTYGPRVKQVSKNESEMQSKYETNLTDLPQSQLKGTVLQ